jgi:hypothetical protein
MAQQSGTTLHKGNTISKPLGKAEYLGEARHIKAKIALTLSKHAAVWCDLSHIAGALTL